MAKHFYSFQFDMPYKSTYLRNWEVPKYYCPKPRRRIGSTEIISNSRGHLLPGVPRPPCNPFGDFIGTWAMPKKITREIANKLNGLADKEGYLEKCRIMASTPPRSQYQKELDEEKKKIRNENKKIEEDEANKLKEAKELEAAKKAEDEFITSDVKAAQSVIREICPIHDF